MRLLTELNEGGKTIIMVTHENDIAAWARRVVRMRDGHIESDIRNDRDGRPPSAGTPHTRDLASKEAQRS
jgi:putative ABC transport system ATP-binding protein